MRASVIPLPRGEGTGPPQAERRFIRRSLGRFRGRGAVAPGVRDGAGSSSRGAYEPIAFQRARILSRRTAARS